MRGHELEIPKFSSIQPVDTEAGFVNKYPSSVSKRERDDFECGSHLRRGKEPRCNSHLRSRLQVIMSTKEAAERACKEPNPIIDGRKANVNLAILGAKPRGNALQSESRGLQVARHSVRSMGQWAEIS